MDRSTGIPLGQNEWDHLTYEDTTMKLSEFIEKYDGAPIDTEELAHRAQNVEDCEDLSQSAFAFLKAHDEFYSALDDIGFEFG